MCGRRSCAARISATPSMPGMERSETARPPLARIQQRERRGPACDRDDRKAMVCKLRRQHLPDRFIVIDEQEAMGRGVGGS